MALAFFGLTPQYRLSVFTQIHEIVFHGGGGYDWLTAYNMPLWLRRFTYNNLLENYKDKDKSGTADEAVQQGMTIARQLSAEKKRETPTYSTKASKK